MEDLKLKSFDEMQDEFFGKIGTPKRDAFEKKSRGSIPGIQNGGSD